jgi:hypothetical protein
MLAYFPVPRRFPIPTEDIQNAFNSAFSIQYESSVVSYDLTKNVEKPKFNKLKKHFRTLKFWNNTKHKDSRGLFNDVVETVEEDNGPIKDKEPLFVTNEFASDTRTLCVVPFPYFLLHTSTRQSGSFGSVSSMFQSTDSPFTKIASSKTFNNIFVESNVNIEALTLYKWSAFAGKRFILILFFHAVYYISFSVGVAFAKEVFGYHLGDSLSHPGHYATITIMFLSWFILFVQEIRQFIYNIAAYIDLYNFVDWSALIMPIASFGLLLTNGKYIVSYYYYIKI